MNMDMSRTGRDVCGIYQILNVITGDCYVGKSVAIRQRWSQHKSELRSGRHGNQILTNVWRKYGVGALEFRLVMECGPAYLGQAEAYWAHYFRVDGSNLPRYNIEDIDENGCKIVTEETKEKQRQSWTLERRATYSEMFSGPGNPMWGSKPSEERIAELTEAAFLLNTEEFREEHSKAMTGNGHPLFGVKRPADFCGKMSEIAVSRGDIRTPQFIEAAASRAAASRKPIMATSLDGATSVIYKSVGDAGKAGFSRGQVRKCCYGTIKNHRGFTWKFLDVKVEDEFRANFKKIMQSSDTKDERIYNSKQEIVSAGFQFAAVSKCCQGKSRRHYGFKWRYANE